MLSVLIVDDHAVVRQGIRQILVEELGEVSVEEANDADQALTMSTEHAYDVAVLDISIPGRSGLELLADLRRCSRRTAVLVLSMHPEHQYAVRALRAGAAGYVTKDSPREEFVRAFRKVVAGGQYVSSSLAERLVADLRDSPKKAPHERLSNREYAVLCALASGKRVSDVAVDLSLSVKTVSTYRRRVLDKLQIRTTAELTRYAIENQLV
jgi:two-component system, NarL family, invasion response regulator UvrY